MSVPPGECASACIFTTGDENLPEVVGTLLVKARKPQVCCECKDPILPGQRYEVVSGKWEGKWSSFKTCLPCKEIRETFCCEGWTYGMLWHDAGEGFLEDLTLGCVNRLTSSAAKEKLLEEWRAARGLG
jgi:hypothetical protein